MTYSIIGVDVAAAEIGVAAQSKFPNVGQVVPYAAAGVGAVVTQGFANPRHGVVGLELLARGASPQQTVDILIAHDVRPAFRQIGVIGAWGESAHWTGSEIVSWDGYAGQETSVHCLAIGNSLVSSEVLERMVVGFERSRASLASRLMDALEEGESAGGELRGMQSSCLIVRRAGAGYEAGDDRVADILIYDALDPIEELRRCWELHRFAYLPSAAENLQRVNGPLEAEIVDLLNGAGFAISQYDGDVGRALNRYMGHYNYDARIREDDLVDVEVLEDMRRNRGARARQGGV